MDTSKEYIKMCDCEEIQNLWKPSVGDFQCSDEGLNLYIQQYTDWDKVNENLEGWKEGAIWLPRQDQLWNMLGDISFEVYKGANVNPEGYGVSHYDSPYDSEPVWHFEGDSLEICLLKILMWEKHTALWTGTEWDRAHWTKEEVRELVK